MKVFVGGATGAIGRPLVDALVAAGHQVSGMTHTPEHKPRLVRQGAEPFVINAFDKESVQQALAQAKPDVVIEELTALPKDYTPDSMRAASANHERMRREGGAILQEAAKAVGARRYIAQSVAFFLAPGEGLADESVGFDTAAPPNVATSASGMVTVERRVLGARGMQGVVLRYGFFYGPGTWNSSEGSVGQQIRGRGWPVLGDGEGVWSFVHVEDAARATVAALDAPPGLYHIVDDQPSPVRVWLPAFARWLGAPPPPLMPLTPELQDEEPDWVYYMTRLRGASNSKARRELRFAPRRLEWLATADAQSSR